MPEAVSDSESLGKEDDMDVSTWSGKGAPAGSGAQRVRMMEGGFRRWPKELSIHT